MHRFRKKIAELRNTKGFSLVELIIVISIMVALVALMGPQYIKYVQSSRDAVVTNAAQDVLSCVKGEVNLGHLYFDEGVTSGTIYVGAGNYNDGLTGNGYIRIVLSDGLEYTDGGSAGFEAFCGADTSKNVKSDLIYLIKIEGDDISAHPELVSIELESTESDEG